MLGKSSAPESKLQAGSNKEMTRVRCAPVSVRVSRWRYQASQAVPHTDNAIAVHQPNQQTNAGRHPPERARVLWKGGHQQRKGDGSAQIRKRDGGECQAAERQRANDTCTAERVG